jgi:hypothetical protein
MRNVDRFNAKQFRRVGKNSKIIYQFTKYGSKGLSKVNPTLVFIDAAVSLGELFISYSAYKQVKEQNKQLKIEIKTLSTEFINLKKSLGLKEDKYKYELKQNSYLMEKKLKNNRQNNEILKKAYKLSKQYFFKMKTEVESYKKEYPYSKETNELEKKYHEVLSLYMNTSFEIIGG